MDKLPSNISQKYSILKNRSAVDLFIEAHVVGKENEKKVLISVMDFKNKDNDKFGFQQEKNMFFVSIYLSHIYRNLLNLRDIECDYENQKIYLIYEYVPTYVYYCLSGILENIHKQFIIYQLLKICNYFHTKFNISFFPIRFNDIGITENCEIKINYSKFLSICEINSEYEFDDFDSNLGGTFTIAPEWKMGNRTITKELDIFSVGIILLYLIYKNSMIHTSTVTSLKNLINITGYVTEDKLNEMAKYAKELISVASGNVNNKVWNDTNEDYQLYLQHVKTTLKEKILKEQPTLEWDDFYENSCDLIAKLIYFEPSKRISIEEAMKHPLFSLFNSYEFYDDFFEKDYNGFNDVLDKSLTFDFDVAICHVKKFKLLLKRQRKEIKKIFKKKKEYFNNLKTNIMYRDISFVFP
ncbi:hypothetical protein ABK040_014029 [Willaertia magna]